MESPTARRRRGTSAARRCSSLATILLVLAASAPAATYSVAGFSDTPVVTGLDQPTDFAFLPNGRILVLEKPGRVKISPGETIRLPGPDSNLLTLGGIA